jgi:hypothetical protein
MPKKAAPIVVRTAVQTEPPAQTRPKCWESFFLCQPNPVLRSELLTALLAGTKLEVQRVPVVSLLDTVMLAFATRTYCNAEIIDDFKALCERAEEEWRKPEWTTRVFDSLHANAANYVINHGMQEFAGYEEQYIPVMAAWYLDHTIPEYFVEEVSDRFTWSAGDAEISQPAGKPAGGKAAGRSAHSKKAAGGRVASPRARSK